MPSKLQKLQLKRIFPKIFRRIIISKLREKSKWKHFAFSPKSCMRYVNDLPFKSSFQLTKNAFTAGRRDISNAIALSYWQKTYQVFLEFISVLYMLFVQVLLLESYKLFIVNFPFLPHLGVYKLKKVRFFLNLVIYCTEILVKKG